MGSSLLLDRRVRRVLGLSFASAVLLGLKLEPDHVGQLAFVFGTVASCRRRAGGSAPAITYDTRWGTATNSSGWITFGLLNRRIWWDSVSGSDANTGLSAAQAVQSFARMWSIFTTGWTAGDQIMVAGGTAGGSYNDPDNGTTLTLYGGTGPSVMTVIQSYDRADPTGATTKYGELVGAAVPVFNMLSANSTFLNVVNQEGKGYVAVKGLEIKDPNQSSRSAALSLGISWATNRHPGAVFQNCRFNGVGFGHDPANDTNTAATNTQNGGLISKCSQWNSGGLSLTSTDSFRIQEFISVHNGWDIGATRDDPIVLGGPAVFTHAYYLHANCTNLALNRIVTVDATDGFGSRAGASSINQIVSIDLPFGLSVGGSSNPVLTEAPNGVPWQLDDALIMGSDKQIQVNNPGGVGIQWLNTVAGSYTRNVALLDFDAYNFDPSYNRYAASSRTDSGQVPNYMLFDKWSGWQFAPTGESDVGTDMGNVHGSWSNSILDVVPTGWNGTVTGTTARSVAPAGYKTRAQIYTAMGYANKAALVNAMLWRPDLPWAQALIGLGLPAMGLSPLYPTVAPPAAVTGAPVIYKTALTDLTASSLNFTLGTPSAIVLSGVAAASYLSCSDLPTGFSMTPFRKTVSGTVTSGSNQITGVSDTSGLLKGQLIEAKSGAFTPVSLFPALTVITGISGTTVTVSNNATGNTTNENIFVSSGGRLLSYDGTGSAGTPTIHVVETAKDSAMGTHTTPLTLNVTSTSATSTFTMTQLAAPNRVYQRATTTGGGQGKGQGTIPVTISGASAGTVNARVRSSDGSTILQPEWTAATITNGATVANIGGVDARLGWFYLDLKDSSGTWKNGTVLVSMGRVVAVSGQSLAARMFRAISEEPTPTNTNASLGITIDNNGVGMGSADGFGPAGWTKPADGSDTSNWNSCFISEFLRLQIAAAGVNCAQVGNAIGSTSITTWVPGGGNNTGLRSTLQAAGGFEAFIWMQGHSDSLAGMSGATYQSNLSTLFTDITAQNGVRGSSYEKYLLSIPNITTGSTWGTPAQINTIRSAASTWAGANGGTYLQPEDIAMASDGTHENNIGARTLARHIHRASRPVFGLSGDDTGPNIASASRSAGSGTLSLTINLPSGATALATAGTPKSRFTVTSHGDLTPRSISSLSFSGTTATLVLGNAPAANAGLDVWFGLAPDPANDGAADMVYDNNTADGLSTGRQLMATVSPVAIAAASAPTLTDNSTTYAAGPSGWGQCLTGGYATGSSTVGDEVIPYAVTAAWEARFLMTTAPGALSVMFGIGGAGWVGMDSTGHITFNYNAGSITSSGTFCDGAWHHVYCLMRPTGVELFVDGVSQGTDTATYNPAGAVGSTVTVGGFLGSGFRWGTAAGNQAAGFGKLQQLATWTTPPRTSAFTPPSTPYVGNEVGLYALYRLNGNLAAG